MPRSGKLRTRSPHKHGIKKEIYTLPQARHCVPKALPPVAGQAQLRSTVATSAIQEEIASFHSQ